MTHEEKILNSFTGQEEEDTPEEEKLEEEEELGE